MKVEIMVPEGHSEQVYHHPTAEEKFLWKGHIPDSTTVVQFLEKLAFEHRVIRDKVYVPGEERFMAEYMIILNGRFLPANEMKVTILRDSDEITILPVPFGG